MLMKGVKSADYKRDADAGDWPAYLMKGVK